MPAHETAFSLHSGDRFRSGSPVFPHHAAGAWQTMAFFFVTRDLSSGPVPWHILRVPFFVPVETNFVVTLRTLSPNPWATQKHYE